MSVSFVEILYSVGLLEQRYLSPTIYDCNEITIAATIFFVFAQTLSSVEEAKTFEDGGEAVVIGLFKSAESEQAKAFMSAAASIDRLPFAITSDKDVRLS